MRPDAEYPTEQPKTIAAVAAGYAELHCGHYDSAIEYFRRVRDPRRTPKFFLHWFWRMTAQLGLSNVWLSSGNLAEGRLESDSFLDAALSTADPHLQALAWEMKARIAIADHSWDAAGNYLHEALSVVEEFEIPVAAWQVHSTAWDFYRHTKNVAGAKHNRTLARRISSQLRIPLQTMNLFANHSSPHLPFIEFSTKHAPSRVRGGVKSLPLDGNQSD